MVTIRMGIILMAPIPIIITDHIITAITMPPHHTIGLAGIGTGVITGIITIIGTNAA